MLIVPPKQRFIEPVDLVVTVEIWAQQFKAGQYKTDCDITDCASQADLLGGGGAMAPARGNQGAYSAQYMRDYPPCMRRLQISMTLNARFPGELCRQTYHQHE